MRKSEHFIDWVSLVDDSRSQNFSLAAVQLALVPAARTSV